MLGMLPRLTFAHAHSFCPSSFLWPLAKQAMKAFIETNFKMIDIDNDGIIGPNEYRYNCITRVAVENIKVVDDAYNKLVDVSIFCLILFRCYA